MTTDAMGYLNAPWLSNTMMRSTRLQMPTLSRLRLNSHLIRWRFLRLPGDTAGEAFGPSSGPSTVQYRPPARYPNHPAACGTVVRWYPRQCSNTTPGPLLAHPHPPSHAPCPVAPHRLGQPPRLSPVTPRPAAILKDGTLDSRT